MTCWSAVVVASFAFGMFIAHYRYWPLHQISYLKQYINWETGLLPRSWPDKQLLAEVDFDQLIQVRDAAAVASKRAQLRDYIWGRDQPHSRSRPIQPPSAEALSYLGMAMGVPDLSLVVDGRYGYRGEAFVWFAKTKSDCLFVYAQGHGKELLNANHRNERQLLKEVLTGGCDILVVSMPLLGVTQKALRATTRFGPLVAQTHDDLAYLEADDFNPLSLFFVHIRAAIDELQSVGKYHRITMAGLSGGGWTTTVYAAIDPRVNASVSVAGSLPVMFRLLDQRNDGDWEQRNGGLLKIADYLDLYVLGAAGNRRAELVYNYNDVCCFGGNAALAFEPALIRAVKRLNGQVGVTVDDTSFGHAMSVLTTKRIASIALSGPTRDSPVDSEIEDYVATK